MKSDHSFISGLNKSTIAPKLTLNSCAPTGVLKSLKLPVYVVVVGIFLALSKFVIVPWQTDLEFYGKNADNIIAMILSVDLTHSP